MESGLDKPFKQYTAGQPEMNGRTFVKVFKDNKLIGKNLSTTDLDIIFSKIKTKGKNKITFAQFKLGVQQVAEKMKVSADAITGKLCSGKGPQLTGTKAQKVALHDDKSKYTGVYAKGGPTTVDKGNSKVSDLSQLTNRKGANVRGINHDIKEGK